ncbi:MAG: nickel pincer cofactor-dependent isomerase, group 22 [Syntrophales bacterium]
MTKPAEFSFPLMYRVDQLFPDTGIKDICGEVRRLLERFDLKQKTQPGQSVAVCVASRGTHDLKDLVATTVTHLVAAGLKPFITPAMGSHGAATGEGQAMVLRGLGITEEFTGVPIRATMDVASLGRVDEGPEIFTAVDALQADHIVVINRVKPHTGFHSDVESGLCKILAIGLGRQVGAANMHKYDLTRCIVPAASLILEKTSVLFGLAVTENALGGTHSVRLAGPGEFAATDRELLTEARELLPRLPVECLDVLIVEKIGKNISGAGMDPNVVGFWRRGGGERKPDYRVLAVLDLTAESHGNAIGIGLADVTTKYFVEKIDWDATYKNALSSKRFTGVRLPMVRDNDALALQVALGPVVDPQQARVGRIISTSDLRTFWVSESVLPQLMDRPNLVLHRDPLTVTFDPQGRLEPFAV